MILHISCVQTVDNTLRRWRRVRRAAHECFHARAAAGYQPLQEKEAAVLTSGLLQDPEKWDDHFRRSASSLIMGVTYGWDPIQPSKDLPYVVRYINDHVNSVFAAIVPGAHLVETFPWMLHLPDWMAKWKRKGKRSFRETSAFFEKLLEDSAAKVNMLQLPTADPILM